MQKLRSNPNRSALAKLAAASEAAELRDAICETELKDCQRTLQTYEIKKSLLDRDEIRALLKIRSFIYGRMADIYSIKEDNVMADYYRLMEDAAHSAVIQGELSKQQNTRKHRRSRAAKPEEKKER